MDALSYGKAANNTSDLAELSSRVEQVEQSVVEGLGINDSAVSAVATWSSDKLNKQLNSHSLQINKNLSVASRNIVANGTLFTFIDDDGNAGVLTKLKPLFTSRNVPCCTALCGNSVVVTDAAQRADMIDLQNNYGWEVLSHTMTHIHLDSSTDAQIEADCANYINLMSGYGFRVNAIAYPWGELGNTEIISRYFSAGITAGEQINGTITNVYKYGRYALGSNMSEGKDTLAFFQGVVDTAITNGNQWVIFMTHCDATGNDMTLIQNVVDYIIAQNGKIVNVAEGLRKFADVLISGDSTRKYFRIKQDGELLSNRYFLTHDISDKTITASTAFSDFEMGVSSKALSIGESGDFPEAGGVLINIKVNSSYSYGNQIWIPYGKTYFYIRRATGTSTWSAWLKEATTTDLAHLSTTSTTLDAYAESTKPSEYAGNRVYSGLVTGWTLGNGIVTTYKVDSTGNDKQEFRRGGTNEVYSRMSATGDTWTAWQKISAV